MNFFPSNFSEFFSCFSHMAPKRNAEGRPSGASSQSLSPASPRPRQSRRTSDTQGSASMAAHGDSAARNLLADDEILQPSSPTPTITSTITTSEKFRVVSTLSYEEIKRLQNFVTSGEAVGGRYNYARLLDTAV